MNKSALIHINPLGFREYDARWLYEKDINLLGIENLGKGLGTQVIKNTQKKNPRIVVGHDYRSYSEEIKKSLKKGLISTGCYVEDIGLSLTPTVYFAQFNLNADAIAMVTASHNENGWTGVKMGIQKGLTHTPDEMRELKDEDDLISRLNSRSLGHNGRAAEGGITESVCERNNTLGYDKSYLGGHIYDKGFIHKEDSLKIKQNQEIMLRATGLKESRFSTIRRWKHKDTDQYVMLCMIWYVDIENDEVEIIAKPIDENLQDSLFAN